MVEVLLHVNLSMVHNESLCDLCMNQHMRFCYLSNYLSNEDSDEPVHMCRLARFFTACIHKV